MTRVDARNNPLLDPDRRPLDHEALRCADCEAFIAWMSPPLPPVEAVCSDCRGGAR